MRGKLRLPPRSLLLFHPACVNHGSRSAALCTSRHAHSTTIGDDTTASPVQLLTTPHVAVPAGCDGVRHERRLSQRQMRQRERRWGPLWRYKGKGHSPFTVSNPLLTTPQLRATAPSPLLSPAPLSAPLHSFDSHAVQMWRDSAASAQVQPPAPRLGSTLAVGGAAEAVHDGSHGAPCAAGRTATGVSSGVAAPTDPLVAFLESNEEDAALLLAMWTSLHRSCVFGSAVSESALLHVRFFFHSLLRSRAVAAAVHWYYRLVGLGVQLQQSDLMLLFASLTYENAASTEAAQLRRAAENAAAEEDRRRWVQRRRQYRESAERTRASATATQQQSSAQQAAATAAPPTAASATSPSGVMDEADGGRDGDAYPPNNIARRVAFHQQPEWVKRWILYEASMGTLDGLDTCDDGSGGESATATATEAEAEAPPSPSPDDEALWAVTAESSEAARVMGAMALVEHLRVLAMGAMQRDQLAATAAATAASGARRRGGALRQRHRYVPPSLSSSASDSTARSYWREALQLARNVYVDSPCLTVRSSAGDRDLPSPPSAARAPLLPESTAVSLQAMLRDVQSWEGALALLRLTTPATSRGAGDRVTAIDMSVDCFQRATALFGAAASVSQPWKAQAGLESWMHRVLLPRLACHETAESTRAPSHSGSPAAAAATTAALRALWLSHLCAVKASRPDEFVALGEEAVAYLPAPAAQRAVYGDLATAAAVVATYAATSIDHLLRAVEEAEQRRRVSDVLATSVRSGAYRVAKQRDEESGTAPEGRGIPTPVPSVASAAHTPHLPGELADVFVVCCAALKEAVWLRFTAAASTNRVAVTAEVLHFLEHHLHGPAGLFVIFSLRYRHAAPGSTTTTKTSSSSSTTSASERAYASCVLATMLLQLVQLLCAPPGRPQRRFGAHLWNGAELVLLAELAATVLEGVSADAVQQVPWRWALEGRLAGLAAAAAATWRTVVRELQIHSKSEKVAFGAVPEDVVQLLALLARVFNSASELAAFSRPRKAHSPSSSSSSSSLVWRSLLLTCSPRTLLGVQLCLASSSALGRRVRQRLSRRDVNSLDRWIQPPRSRRPAVSRLRGGPAEAAVVTSRLAAEARAAAMAGEVGRNISRDFPLAVGLRDSVYGIVRRESTSAGVGAALQQLARATTGWKASLALWQLATKDVGLARGTCDIGFFATTLERVTQDLTESTEAVARSSLQHRGGRPARGSVGPSNLWLRAIDVFWSAVDHAGGTTTAAAAASTNTAVAEALLPSTGGTSLAGVVPPHLVAPVATAEAQERAVLARLLLPLLRFSQAVRRRDVGQRWRRAWEAQYSPQERRQPGWREQNIKALSLLGDPTALPRCVAEYSVCGSESLLCSVAVRHGDWHAALQALLHTYGAVEERLDTGQRYSPAVALTLLALLAKSPMNLSNTAMRVRAVQGDAWDVPCGIAVVQLLLRSRRWRLALSHADEALALPEMQHVRAVVAGDSQARTLTTRSVGEYANLLTLALQAAAVGGVGDRAPVYYDAFKALARHVDADDTVDDGQQRGHETAGSDDQDGLEQGLSMASASIAGTQRARVAQGEDDDAAREVVRELAPRARLLFFRAMTKKLLSTSGTV
ncbi:hypothetical protein NESM_000237300 [Novymonas esmeraldas]|uniref:Uncharacterized protein n=1 Tax=Novymonas esmeraldas TaxID=1808958 RepID=A0AAW0FAS1_9TRYP